MSTILQENIPEYKGIGNIWFNNTLQSYFVTIGDVDDEIPCNTKAFIKILSQPTQRKLFGMTQ